MSKRIAILYAEQNDKEWGALQELVAPIEEVELGFAGSVSVLKQELQKESYQIILASFCLEKEFGQTLASVVAPKPLILLIDPNCGFHPDLEIPGNLLAVFYKPLDIDNLHLILDHASTLAVAEFPTSTQDRKAIENLEYLIHYESEIREEIIHLSHSALSNTLPTLLELLAASDYQAIGITALRLKSHFRALGLRYSLYQISKLELQCQSLALPHDFEEQIRVWLNLLEDLQLCLEAHLN